MTGDDMMACHFLGSAYAEGRGVPMDPARAAQLYDRACQHGSGNGCNNLGQLIQEGRVGASRDPASAAMLLRPRVPAWEYEWLQQPRHPPPARIRREARQGAREATLESRVRARTHSGVRASLIGRERRTPPAMSTWNALEGAHDAPRSRID